MKLNVGLARKAGLPNYGSIAASCYLEVELEQSLLFNDLETFHKKVEHAYVACRKAVQDELARSDTGRSLENQDQASTTSGESGASPANGWHQVDRSAPRLATSRQVGAIERMALRQRVDLFDLLQSRFEKEHLRDLSRSEASRLIDELATVGACETANEEPCART